MIMHTVKPGDMIGVLAVRYKTTIRILMEDNPFIPDTELLQPGWRLTIYTPEENAIRYADTAYEHTEKVQEMKAGLDVSDHFIQEEIVVTKYKNRDVHPGQIAFGRVIADTPLIQLLANGKHKVVRTLKKGAIFNIFDISLIQGTYLYLTDSAFFVGADSALVKYDEVPQYNREGKVRLKKANEGFLQAFATPKVAASKMPAVPQAYYGNAPGGNPSTKKLSGIASMKSFERPGYKRPILLMKNAKGQTSRVELRTTGFSANYGNNVSPSPTNGGWAINVGPSNLATLTITGFLLETKAVNEFEPFMERYHKYLKSTNVGDYYSMGISTFYYKKTEYKGVITSFGYTDREEESLHRKYTLQMLVFKEKALSSKELSAVTPVVSRGGKTEKDFRSDIASMLYNTVNGTRSTDFY